MVLSGEMKLRHSKSIVNEETDLGRVILPVPDTLEEATSSLSEFSYTILAVTVGEVGQSCKLTGFITLRPVTPPKKSIPREDLIVAPMLN